MSQQSTPALLRPGRAFALCCFTALMLGCGYVPFSGGELNGTLTPAPAQWGSIADVNIIELETNPTEPYSVKLWIVDMGPSLYVHAGANQATWVVNIEQDPNVRLLVGELLYELRAERVATEAEFASFSDRYEEKYGNRPRNENVAEAYLFRLQPRN
ncbi:hypothetical protein EYC98_18315 [Halieaceae bacterium IMCC14734]|uniref:DUF385 domain-containing protein n=1 Tax=Candidatus Litorirhabdus singularis TaxID=2518993 RepID=A0ABT3TKN2_9GAMM|nr:hypothetical protein [Candidatus Litorirhabdus singularis]MCX2982821.1 hypothetical protein [Candidatus Litorirhabdus singularis]